MSPLTYSFTGRDGQTVAAVDGVVTVRVWDVAVLVALQDAALDPVRVTATGPFTGGQGLEDPTSAYYAARAVVPMWTFSGDTPEVPEIPPWDPGVVYSPSR
ncbi:hypothetical protein G6030_01675 [Dietzia sp. E1]|uniref:hypothetical protein n=1 Tax=Dietzia sp. E1 TaxID=328361 RepID=UPI0015FBB946|nr:hypothetical protein [Dietzia sp. E1]MBB1020021.1 hypothetical protein [Dietzia sp. E1]